MLKINKLTVLALALITCQLSASLDEQLVNAVNNGEVDKIQELVQAGAKIDFGPRGDTPLMLAAMKGHKEIVRELIAAGANVNAKEWDLGWTPLMWAASKGYETIVKTLIDAKANVNATDYMGRTPLMRAALNGHTKIVKMLIDTGCANIIAKDHSGKTALTLAASTKHTEIVRLLRLAKTDLDATMRRTPFMLAASTGNIQLTQEEMNEQLRSAIFWNKDEDVRELLAAGANPDYRPYVFGTDARQFAEQCAGKDDSIVRQADKRIVYLLTNYLRWRHDLEKNHYCPKHSEGCLRLSCFAKAYTCMSESEKDDLKRILKYVLANDYAPLLKRALSPELIKQINNDEELKSLVKPDGFVSKLFQEYLETEEQKHMDKYLVRHPEGDYCQI